MNQLISSSQAFPPTHTEGRRGPVVGKASGLTRLPAQHALCEANIIALQTAAAAAWVISGADYIRKV